MLIKGLFKFLILSLVVHSIIIFHDQWIKHKKEVSKKELATEEKTPRVIPRDIKDEMEALANVEKFIQESPNYSEFTKKAVEEFIEKQRNVLNKKVQQYNEVAKGFKSFIPKLVGSRSPNPLKVNLKKEIEPESEGLITQGANIKCSDKDSFIGLGLLLNVSPKNPKDFYNVYEVAEGYVAHRNNIKPNQVFVGIINKTGQFFPGNSYVSSKKGSIGELVRVLIRDNNTIIEKTMTLEKICYKSVSKDNLIELKK